MNEDLASLTHEVPTDEVDGPVANHPLAKQMLVFMIRPIFKPSLSFPIVSYPTSNLSGEKLYPVAMEVVEALELCNLPVMAITSDGHLPIVCSTDCADFRMAPKFRTKQRTLTLTETFTFFVILHTLSRWPEIVLVIPTHIQRTDHFR